MIRYLIYLEDMIVNHNIHMIVLFITFVWAVFLIKFIYANKHKDVIEDYTGNVSIIVPVLNEDLTIFNKCLKSIYCNMRKNDELVVVFDKKNSKLELFDIAKKYTKNILKAKIAGKRENILTGLEITKNDVIVLVDSDTILTEKALSNLIKPFNDSTVGGVVGRQKILNSEYNMITKTCNWIEDMRFNLTVSAESHFGQIGCMPGRMTSYRKNILVRNKDRFKVQKFIGRCCKNGDDRCLTSLTLNEGFKTVYQSSSVVYTDSPTTLTGFMKQQLRWSRGSQRGYLLSLKWVHRKPFLFFCSTANFISPYLLLVVISFSIYEHFYCTPLINMSIPASILMSGVCVILSKSPRQYPHLKENKKDIIYLPVYLFISVFLLLLLRFGGLITIRKNDWITR